MRYIEVLANVRVEREIEAYEATLELSVSTGKRTSCMDESLALREDVLATLKNAGLSDADVREGGGEASLNVWSSSKSIVHRIVVRNASMELLMSAMGAVERLFAARPQPVFARVKRHFTFHSPTPVYAATASANDALRAAIRRSRTTAELLAQESGVRLGGVLAIREAAAAQPRDVYPRQPLDRPDDSSDSCLAFDEPADHVSYTGLPSPTGKGVRRFLVRFAIEDAVPTDEPEKAKGI